MFRINDDIKRPWKLARGWFNAVAKFINNICGDGIIKIEKPNEPTAMTPVRFSIDTDELKKRLDLQKEHNIPFRVKVDAETSSGTTTYTTKVYLPSLQLYIGEVQYSIEDGSETGQVSEIADEPNWYKINGITTGNIFLNDTSTFTTTESTRKLGFSETRAESPTFSRHIATINDSHVVIQDGVELILRQEDDKRNSQICRKTNATDINDRTVVPENTVYQLDPHGWKRGVDATTDANLNQSDRTLVDDASQEVTLNSLLRVGIRFQVVTRIVRNDTKDLFYWRWATFDKDGKLCELSAEQGVLAECNKSFY